MNVASYLICSLVQCLMVFAVVVDTHRGGFKNCNRGVLPHTSYINCLLQSFSGTVA